MASEPPESLTYRLTALLLLEQVGDDIAASGQANLIAFNLSYKAARNVVVMIGVGETAVSPDQLDPVFLDAIDSADVRTVRADHFHMLTNVFQAAHLVSPSGSHALERSAADWDAR